MNESPETQPKPEAGLPLGAAPCSAIPASAIKAMCEAWTEMNTIRARDGVPYMHNGYKSDVSQEYWDDIMQRLDDEVKAATGRGCWLHPALYSPNGCIQQPRTTEDDFMSDVNERSAAMLGSAFEVATDGPSAASIAEAALAVVCELAERLTGDRPVVKVLFGENSQNYVMWTYHKGGRVTWVRASEEVSGRFQA